MEDLPRPPSSSSIREVPIIEETEEEKKASSPATDGVSNQSLSQKLAAPLQALEKAEAFLSRSMKTSEGSLDFLKSYIGWGLAEDPTENLYATEENTQANDSFPDFTILTPNQNSKTSWLSLISSALPSGAASSGAGGGGGAGPAAAAAAGGGGGLRARALLRPDVPARAVLDAFRAVAARRGLAGRASPHLHRMEAFKPTVEAVEDSKGVYAVRLDIGVASDKLRVAMIHFQEQEFSTESTVGTDRTGTVTSFYEDFRDTLLGEKLALSCLKGEVGTSADLDLSYVVDLIDAFNKEMMADLVAFAEPLDDLVRARELQGAGMMHLLQKTYAEAGLTAPRPTRARPLGRYPLLLPTAAARPLGALLADRAGAAAAARRLLAQAQAGAEAALAAAGEAETVDAGRRAAELCRAAWGALARRAQGEARARVRRKTAQVMDRIENVNSHRKAMISTLLDSDLLQYSPVNQNFQMLFPPLQDEVVLYDCPASASSKKGTLFFCSRNICFYHMSLLRSVTQFVIPLSSVTQIKREMNSINLGGSLLLFVQDQDFPHIFSLSVLEAEYVKMVEDLACYLHSGAAKRKRQKKGPLAPGPNKERGSNKDLVGSESFVNSDFDDNCSEEEEEDALISKVRRLAKLAGNTTQEEESLMFEG